MPGCSVQTADNATVLITGMLHFPIPGSRWTGHTPTWHVRNVILAVIIAAFQQIAQTATQNRQVITARTAPPAIIPVTGMLLSHIPTPAAAAASITIAQPALIVTQVATIPHPIVVNVMTAITPGMAKAEISILIKFPK